MPGVCELTSRLSRMEKRPMAGSTEDGAGFGILLYVMLRDDHPTTPLPFRRTMGELLWQGSLISGVKASGIDESALLWNINAWPRWLKHCLFKASRVSVDQYQPSKLYLRYLHRCRTQLGHASMHSTRLSLVSKCFDSLPAICPGESHSRCL